MKSRTAVNMPLITSESTATSLPLRASSRPEPLWMRKISRTLNGKASRISNSDAGTPRSRAPMRRAVRRSGKRVFSWASMLRCSSRKNSPMYRWAISPMMGNSASTRLWRDSRICTSIAWLSTGLTASTRSSRPCRSCTRSAPAMTGPSASAISSGEASALAAMMSSMSAANASVCCRRRVSVAAISACSVASRSRSASMSASRRLFSSSSWWMRSISAAKRMRRIEERDGSSPFGLGGCEPDWLAPA